MRKAILDSVTDAVRAMESLKSEEALLFIEKSARLLADTFEAGHKLLICGNGGSLCDAMHFAEELTGYYRTKRKAFPAIALAEPGHLTCVGNDVGYERVFSRGVEAYGQAGDVLVVLTTSGNSKNLVWAVEEAVKRGLKTVAFLGKNGGQLKGVADLEWIVSGFPWSDRVQEAHMAAIHIIIEQMETLLLTKQLLHVAGAV
jgi:D-sedoheptulose 7-phosphate isomerase